MLFAANGDVEAAVTAHRAMVEHDCLPMPFARARTQFCQGQLQRRLRQREALRRPCDRRSLRSRSWGAARLTAAELRVAELAATGITNREMAAALFISPKTVEANLSRIYRELNIHSRAELGRVMGRSDG
jgi:DNA-binding CsgD family transcriptional regulator